MNNTKQNGETKLDVGKIISFRVRCYVLYRIITQDTTCVIFFENISRSCFQEKCHHRWGNTATLSKALSGWIGRTITEELFQSQQPAWTGKT